MGCIVSSCYSQWFVLICVMYASLVNNTDVLYCAEHDGDQKDALLRVEIKANGSSAETQTNGRRQVLFLFVAFGVVILTVAAAVG